MLGLSQPRHKCTAYLSIYLFQATLDSAGGPGRVMAGVVNTNGRQLGSFSAAPIE